MKNIKCAIVVLSLFTACSPLFADRNLDVKKAEKQEIRDSMVGFRNTIIFYTFKDQQAILQILIDNKDETFPVTGKILLFDESTTEEGLKKWINNQHSDGLFPEVPEPTFTKELPKEACKATAHKLTDTSKNPGPNAGDFKNFEVDFSVTAFEIDKKFKLSAFNDTTKVHVESK